MIGAGLALVLVYLFPYSPDILLILGVWLMLFGTIRAYFRPRRTNHSSN